MHLLSRLERLLQMDTVSLDIRKSAPNHVSVAEEKLFPIMVERTRTTPFVECKWSDGEFFAYEFFPRGSTSSARLSMAPTRPWRGRSGWQASRLAHCASACRVGG